ncbi:MAG: RluA family pseudouridine synthase [Gammaproteobacteria bacterium]|nr:MAG: RluA family pseudouridine synthase [Gammaproteobacteria bacterium]
MPICSNMRSAHLKCWQKHRLTGSMRHAMGSEARQWQWVLDVEVCAADWLAKETGLSKGRVKDAMNKGAVLLKRGRQPEKRLRRATFRLLPGDRLALNHDPEILACTLEQTPVLISEQGDVLEVYKPVGWLSQGSPWGDHLSVERWLQTQGYPDARVVHRLDRETAGVMLYARRRHVAGTLNQLFQNRRVRKLYLARVAGHCPEPMTVQEPLDGKSSVSHVRPLIKQDPALVEVDIETGRFHQVRRHLAHMRLPVLGDPRYGEGNAHPDGLHLVAYRLIYPWKGQLRDVRIPESLMPPWSIAPDA